MPQALEIFGGYLWHLTKDYAHTLLWSELDDQGNPLDEGSTWKHLSQAALWTLAQDVLSFLDAMQAVANTEAANPSSPRESPSAVVGQTPASDQSPLGRYLHDHSLDSWSFHELTQLTHDLALSRNGHGAGFFDGNWEFTGYEGLCGQLQALARTQGERHLYRTESGVIEIL